MFDFISGVIPCLLLTAFLTLGILIPFLITYYGNHKLATFSAVKGLNLFYGPRQIIWFYRCLDGIQNYNKKPQGSKV